VVALSIKKKRGKQTDDIEGRKTGGKEGKEKKGLGRPRDQIPSHIWRGEGSGCRGPREETEELKARKKKKECPSTSRPTPRETKKRERSSRGLEKDFS